MPDKKKIKKKLYLFLGVFLLIVLCEFMFDFVEIVLGEVMLLTNSQRPQTGRLWTEEEKDLNGQQQVIALQDSLPVDTLSVVVVQTLEDLGFYLTQKPGITVTKKTFLTFYKNIPADIAKSIIDPLELYELSRNDVWMFTKFERTSLQTVTSFLDGFQREIKSVYVDNKILFQDEDTDLSESKLENIPQYKDRVISADLFLKAFDSLNKSLKLQIINDPYKLIAWGDNLQWVGVSSQVIDGSVTFAFEVRSGAGTHVYEMNASELAAGYFIAQLNQIQSPPVMALPVK